MTLRHLRTIQGVAAALSVCAFAAPTASAIPAEQFLQDANDRSAGSSSVSPPPSSMASSAARDYEKLRAPDDATVPVRVVTVRADSGFDWGDAGIGAGGLFALAAIGAGAAVATGHRPGRRQLPQPGH
jgi:hypothetical protein